MKAGDALAAFRGLKRAHLPALTADGTILVLAPHPDDESLGCGGLIALAAAAGRPCAVILATHGEASHPGSRAWPPERLASRRAEEALQALDILGQPRDRVAFLGLPDGGVPAAGDAFDAAVAMVVALAGRHGCATIAAPWIHDPHCDHAAVQLIARNAARRAGLRLLSYPVWGLTLAADTDIDQPSPIAGIRLDIGAVRGLKRQAVAAHRTQHGLVIADDPAGFVLPEVLLRACDHDTEVFIET
jgi:LmbE family N-acetylglucosaminyl deacetylase